MKSVKAKYREKQTHQSDKYSTFASISWDVNKSQRDVSAAKLIKPSQSNSKRYGEAATGSIIRQVPNGDT